MLRFAGNTIGWGFLLFGLLRFGMGLHIATSYDNRESMIAASKRYLGSATSGEAIDEGLFRIAIGVGFLLLVAILNKVSANVDRQQ